MTNPGTANLMGWWSMDELSGTRENNAGYWNDLTDVNTVDYYRWGKRWGCINPDQANNEYLWTAHSTFLDISGDNPISVGLWFQPHQLPASVNTPLFAKWSTTTEKQFIVCTNGTAARFAVHDGTSSYWVTSTVTLQTNVWYFVCCYFDPTQNEIGVGVNDVWTTNTGPSTGIDWTNTTYLYVGWFNGSSYYYDGYIDEVFIYKNTLLSSASRTWLYNSGAGRCFEDVNKTPPVSIPIQSSSDTVLVHVYDNTLKRIGIIDDYYSLIWTERYNEVGDFEMELPISYQFSSLIDFGNFLYIKSSDKLMIIDSVKPLFSEDQISLIVTGESAESLLKKRFSEYELYISEPAELRMYKLLNNHFIDPVDTKRQIDLFDPIFPGMLLDFIFTDSLDIQSIYDIIKTIGKAADYGFKIIPYNDKLVFLVYNGTDYSYGQTDNPWVIFSDKFDNVLSSSYFETDRDEISLVTVYTNDSVYPDTDVWAAGTSEPEDLARKESSLDLTIDRDVVSPALTDAEVLAIINSRGRQIINDSVVRVFEGEFDIFGTFKYGIDFFLGDIVQIVISSQETAVRIIEIVHSYTAEGNKVYVSFDYSNT